MVENIIDMHMHIEFDRSVDRKEYSAFPEKFEEYVEHTGIEKALVLTYCANDCSHERHSVDELMKINRNLSDYVRGKNNLFAFARVDPTMSHEDTERILLEISRMNFVGIKLHPMDGFSVENLSAYKPIFDFAVQHKMPVMVHTWYDTGAIHWPKVISHMPVRCVAEVAKKYDIPFIAAHANIGEDPSIEECMEVPNLYLDTSVQPMHPLVQFATMNPDSHIWDRVFYGSDFAVFRLPKFQCIDLITPEKIREQTPDIAERLLKLNAERFIQKFLK